jgi:hypothetical protein
LFICHILKRKCELREKRKESGRGKGEGGGLGGGGGGWGRGKAVARGRFYKYWMAASLSSCCSPIRKNFSGRRGKTRAFFLMTSL